MTIKQWWATTTHGLEWPKSQTLATPNTGEDSGHRKLSHLPPVGRQDGAATPGVSLKVKPTLPLWSRNGTSQHLPQRVENFCPPQSQPTNMYSSIIYKCRNVGATKVSSTKWPNELWSRQTVEHESHGKEMSPESWREVKEKMPVTKRKKPIWKGSRVYDFNSTMVWKRQNYGDGKTIRVWLQADRGRDE